jgi:hypothetical protein
MASLDRLMISTSMENAQSSTLIPAHEERFNSFDHELDIAFQTLTATRSEIYKQFAEIDLLCRKADDLSTNVIAQCNPDYDYEDEELAPFYLEAFEQELSADVAGLIHCFPTTVTGLRSMQQTYEDRNNSIESPRHVKHPRAQSVQFSLNSNDLFCS